MTKLETIAKAIYERRNGHGCKAWAHLPKAHQGPYLADARAAVEAMREPSKEMIVAGDGMKEACIDSEWGSDSDGNRYVDTTINSDLPALVYRAMIDAILNEEKP